VVNGKCIQKVMKLLYIVNSKVQSPSIAKNWWAGVYRSSKHVAVPFKKIDRVATAQDKVA